MFTGIVETTGIITDITILGTNKSFWIKSSISAELKMDQSVAHNGVCLTIEEVLADRHKVTAVAETLEKTELNDWLTGSSINLERSLMISSRLDGHFVQGHVDSTATCKKIKDKDGSFEFEFLYSKKFASFIIEKGSICVNGISLTAFDVKKSSFKVAIIPYTYEHTNLRDLKENDSVNLEFDMIGKYILRNQNLNKIFKI
jgi:riboflavin synthase